MPRTPWRRRTTDSPRPTGRLAGGLRRGGSFARQVLLVRVAHRRFGVATGASPALVLPQDAAVQTPRRRRIRNRRRFVFVDQLGGAPGVAPAPTPPPRAPLDAGLLGSPVPDDASELDRLARTAPTSPAVGPVGPVVPPAVPGVQPVTDAGAHAASRPAPLLPGPQTLARKARFIAANACTVGSLLLGMLAIFFTLGGDLRPAALSLIGGVVCDGLDGALARRLGVSSPFGAQLDSMADMCTFGIATPVVVYAWLHGSAPIPAVAVACALIAASAAIRLARFNVSPYDGRFFAGVPTTMAAAVLSVGTLIGVRLPGLVAVAAIVLVGLAMVSSFPYAKLSRIAKLPPWVWLMPAVGVLLDYRVTFALVVLAYLASGPLLWLHRRSAV